MPPTPLPDGRVPVVLSAHADDLVNADAEAILRYLDRGPDVNAVAATLLGTRRLRRHRAVVRAADLAELKAGLRAVSAGEDHPLVARSSESRSTRTAFVFPGQGNQWPSMGADAYRQLPVYRSHVDRCAGAFVDAGEASPLPYLVGESSGNCSQVQIQAAQFAHAVGLAHVWRSCGVLPDVVVGHSLGEVAAAYIAGSIALADAATVVVARAKVVDGLPGRYGMAVLGISADDAEQLVAAIPGWLEISVVNSTSSVVVSGERDAISALVAAASDKGLFARELDVNYPAHTSALEPMHDALAALLPRAQFTDAPVQFIGSATAAVVAAGTDFADYWYRNLRNTVRFDRAVAVARQHSVGAFIELSAHPSLVFALADLVGDGTGEPPLVVGSGQRDEPLVDALSASIAAAAVTDPGYRWADLVDVRQPLLQGFPNAPMRAVRLWATPKPLAPVYGLTVSAETWEIRTEPAPPPTVCRVAVVDLSGPPADLGNRLRIAVQHHHSAQHVDPADADLVVGVAPLLDHPDAEQAVGEIARAIGTGLLDYVDAAGPACREICLVTVGGEHVRPGEPVALPAQAALAAMHRSIGFERPEQVFRHLDLPSWEPDDAAASAIVDALISDVQEGAVRDGAAGPVLYVRTLPESVEPAPPWQLDTGLLDDVVITGGSGAVGLHFARYLADRGARRIVLLSRGGVDDTAKAEIADKSVEILAPPCDVTSADQVSAAAQQHGGGGASLVIHAAGAATFADHDAITAAAFADTAAAKIGGLARLAELWPMRPDARILVCSSVSGVWGGRGHAAYSAANRMLDVMAGQLRAKGQHCIAARYGLWRGGGIADAAQVTRIERSGLLPMAPEAAVAASLRDHAADPLLLTADHSRLNVFLDSEVVGETPSQTTVPVTEADTGDRVKAELAAVLNLEPTSIDLGMSLLDLGVDSLLALDLRKRLLRLTGTKVALATLLGGVTGDELIAGLESPEQSEKVETTRD